MDDISQHAGGLGVEAADWFFQNSLDLFAMVRRGVVVRVNPAFCAMTGWSPAEIAGRRLKDLAHPEEADLIRENAAVLAAKGACTFDHRILKKDG